MIKLELTAEELGCNTLKLMLLHLFQEETLLFHFPSPVP